jgi:hypothetical protein
MSSPKRDVPRYPEMRACKYCTEIDGFHSANCAAPAAAPAAMPPLTPDCVSLGHEIGEHCDDAADCAKNGCARSRGTHPAAAPAAPAPDADGSWDKPYSPAEMRALIEQQARELAAAEIDRRRYKAKALAWIESNKELRDRAERAERDLAAEERGQDNLRRIVAGLERERDAARAAIAAADAQLSRVLHEMAGSVSLCWEPKPTGVFHSTQACEFVAAAIAELRTLLRAAMGDG